MGKNKWLFGMGPQMHFDFHESVEVVPEPVARRRFKVARSLVMRMVYRKMVLGDTPLARLALGHLNEALADSYASLSRAKAHQPTKSEMLSFKRRRSMNHNTIDLSQGVLL